MKTIKVRDSKFGPALVIETSPQSGGYILGFRVDPADKLADINKEITSLFTVFSANPIFGVEFTEEDTALPLDKVRATRVIDDVQIVGDDDDAVDTLAMYYADAQKSSDREPVFNEKLGLAVESLHNGLTVEKLWNVV
jgi:Bardet-Biedl syndrome 5 protein